MNKEDEFALNGVISICRTHAQRLNAAISKITEIMPVTHEKLSSLSVQQIAYFELFVNRFEKLQDTMGKKLFPMILELTKEPGEFPSFIDKLNQLEKIKALPSVQQWLKLREIRNKLSHDYPENSEEQAALLNDAYKHVSELLMIFEYILKYIEQHSKNL